ncbi:hypothetical protein ABZY68_21520 [Streptomyces sp. NPDC006482]|uniref:hypothetical protein n=1 Tax=Streptomyces sp. NPDC006482 TaxID=3154306 RepID=UPI00339DD1C4
MMCSLPSLFFDEEAVDGVGAIVPAPQDDSNETSRNRTEYSEQHQQRCHCYPLDQFLAGVALPLLQEGYRRQGWTALPVSGRPGTHRFPVEGPSQPEGL